MSITKVGKDWQSLPQKTTWVQYAATLTGSSGDPTGTNLGRASAESNVYRRHGDLVLCRYKFSCSELVSAGSGYWGVSLPFRPKCTEGDQDLAIGQWFFYNTSSGLSIMGDVLMTRNSSIATPKIERLGCPVAPAGTGGSEEMRYLGDGSSSLAIPYFPAVGQGFHLEMEFFYEALT